MEYQKRYLRHQAKKKRQITNGEGTSCTPVKKGASLETILNRRRSQRVFNGESIGDDVLKDILLSATTAPNSCNRHGIKLRVVTDRREKELLSGLLVGGVGWIHRADKIILFFADSTAYASPNEKEFMHYCDVGFTAMSMWLTAEAYNIGCSYINPNVYYKDILDEHFGGDELIFCGALVLGKYYKNARATKAEPGVLKDMLL